MWLGIMLALFAMGVWTVSANAEPLNQNAPALVHVARDFGKLIGVYSTAIGLFGAIGWIIEVCVS